MAPKRPSPTAQPRWAPKEAPRKPPGSRRPKLNEEELQKLSDLMRERFKWDAEPRFFQLEGVRAQIEGVDMIIQAPTGSGKTAVAAGPHVWPTSKGKVTIMVCPLLALEEEMVRTPLQRSGTSPVLILLQGGNVQAGLRLERCRNQQCDRNLD